ncbi:MAG: hypothetical protein CMF69_04955 [Magnetovibrio sp.]|nr:hypothetical protein [Magnetovibrio sp.]|tara:strand:+ start:147 stop:737 length:591 start_codon:yes stop_codon:yes gene_type:complete
MGQPLILASKSVTRQRLLSNAGIEFEVYDAGINEAAIKSCCKKENHLVADTALKLARTKGSIVSTRFPNSLVISADQMLEQGKEWYSKPISRDVARTQLKALSGKTHKLVTACCIYIGKNEKWHNISVANMKVRRLNDKFIENYIDEIGHDALISAGVYQIEGKGINLFDSIDGDFFSILGLPILPLLAFLRTFTV